VTTGENQQVSAPPAPRRPQLLNLQEAEQDFDDAAPFHGQASVAAAPVVHQREIMRISDKTNYRHYYTMPARVGMVNVPRLVDEMIREGCDLRDVVIDFEYEEFKA
jgi:hypothetical protein